MNNRYGTLSLNPKGNEAPYSMYFLRTMFGLSAMPKQGLYIQGDAKTFNELAPQYTQGYSVSGVQKKLLMALVDGVIKPVANNGVYIVKPAPDEFPSLPENEHAIMQLAKACGFDVAPNALVPFENGELAYVTKRFDIDKNGKRLFIEDAASLCLVAPVNKGSDALSYEKALSAFFLASGNNLAVLMNGFRQVLFAYIVGNNDLHLKNMSLFRPSNTRSHVMTNFTPVYDALSVAPYPDYYGDDLSLSLLDSEVDSLFSEAYELYGYYTLHDFIVLAKNIGLPKTTGETIARKLIDAVDKAYAYIIDASQCPVDMKHVIKNHIAERLSRLSRPFPLNDQIISSVGIR